MIDLNNLVEALNNNLQSISDNTAALSAHVHSNNVNTTKLPPSQKENAMRILEAMLSDHQTAALVVTPTGGLLNSEKHLIDKAIELAKYFEEIWDETHNMNSGNPNPNNNPF